MRASHRVVEAVGDGDAKAIDTGEEIEPGIEGWDEEAALKFARLAIGRIRLLGSAETADRRGLILGRPPDRVSDEGGSEEECGEEEGVTKFHSVFQKSR